MTKSSDRIQLPNGDVMTLGEALDRGLLRVFCDNYYDPPRYFASDGTEQAIHPKLGPWGAAKNSTVSWQIGKTLFLSRAKQSLPFGTVNVAKAHE